MFEFFLLVLAIENMADICTYSDILEPVRIWIETTFPKIGKLVRCKYCKMFWFALLFSLVAAPSWLISCFALHRVAFLVSEFYERYINRAPYHLYVQQAPQSKDAQGVGW